MVTSMSNVNEIFSEKYDLSQFENFVEVVNTSDDFLETALLKKYSDLNGFIIASKNNIEIIKDKLNPNTKILDAENSIPTGYKLFITKHITDVVDVDHFELFLSNLHKAMDEYSRVILLEKNIEMKEIEDQMNIKNMNDIDYVFSESGFMVTNVIKIDDKEYIIEALRR